MTDTTPAAPDGSGGAGYPSPPECGVDLLDELKCEAKGVKAQADYNALHTLELETARKSYDTARVQYRKARDDAKKTHKEVGAQLQKVLEQLRCLIDNPTKVGWLDDAFDRVEEQLRVCGGESGCGFDDDCDFDDLVACPPKDVAGAIKKIEERVTEAKKVFDDLVKEPTELPKRVAALQKEVDDIVKAMATDSRSVDFKGLYAKASVARYHCTNLWRGFHDGNAYVDCICRTLLCQLRGYDAVSQLTRRQAVDICRAESEAEWCTQLRAHTDTAVMEEYEKIKAAHDQGHGGKGGDYAGQQDDDGYGPAEGYPSEDGDESPPPADGGDYERPPADEYGPPPGDDERPPSGDDERPPRGDYGPPKSGGDFPPKPGGDYGPPRSGGYGSRPSGQGQQGDDRRGGRPGLRRPRG